MLRSLIVTAMLSGLGVLACGSKQPAAGSPVDPRPASVKAVQAVVLANECSALAKQNAKPAEEAMNKLVEKCTSVPHGAVHFAVVLHPGGGLEFAPSARGDAGAPADASAASAASDEVPLCVLSHKLTHQVKLQKPCREAMQDGSAPRRGRGQMTC
jgi:hypothetical protein